MTDEVLGGVSGAWKRLARAATPQRLEAAVQLLPGQEAVAGRDQRAGVPREQFAAGCVIADRVVVNARVVEPGVERGLEALAQRARQRLARAQWQVLGQRAIPGTGTFVTQLARLPLRASPSVSEVSHGSADLRHKVRSPGRLVAAFVQRHGVAAIDRGFDLDVATVWFVGMATRATRRRDRPARS
jgi:hypothetical protein